MVKIKTFGQVLKIFETQRELYSLDEDVNRFIRENKISRIISVSDAVLTAGKGETQGIIRVVAYEE